MRDELRHRIGADDPDDNGGLSLTLLHGSSEPLGSFRSCSA
jgi:hypothetical protein